MMRTLLCVLLTALVSCSVSAANQSNPKVTLTFIWHAGDRANLLQKIAQKYTAQTGVKIMAVLLRIGWPVRVAFFRGPDGDLIELLQDKTGYT